MTAPGAPGAPSGAAVDRVRRAFDRIAEVDRPEVWITLRPWADVLADAALVDAAVARGDDLPLAGTVLAVKDNIDVAGLPTTAGCPAYAYRPALSAPAVDRLVGAGAVVLGKTNLDQFATGLVGVRSPYGAVRDARRPELISGGSSAGSAVAVALGIADLALATDTAGSGRVPAALQGVVGIKGTRGLVPTVGVVPACRSLDCVTVFAPTLAAADHAMGLLAGPDAADPTSRSWPADAPLAAPARPRVAVPPSGQLGDLDPSWLAAFERTAARLEAAGAELVPIELGSFLDAARMMYHGAFVAERYAAVGEFVSTHRDEVDPTVGSIIEAAGSIPAHRLTRDLERLDHLRMAASEALGDADVLLLPTTTYHPTIEAVRAEPIAVNSRLGTYTNFCNLLDLCAVALPSGEVDASGASFGVSIVGRAFADRVVADVAALLDPSPSSDPRGSGGRAGGPVGVELLVVGAHLSGMPLNHQLTSRGGRFVRAVRTAPDYALYALDTQPPKPGLVRVVPFTPELQDDGSPDRADPTGAGVAVEGELWELPPAGMASFLAELPSPMALGSVRLEDGTSTTGFLCEPLAIVGARDISAFGGWRDYVLSAGSPRR